MPRTVRGFTAEDAEERRGREAACFTSAFLCVLCGEGLELAKHRENGKR
jgi:hypothetical protein